MTPAHPPPTWLASEPAVERVQLDATSWVDVVRGLVPAAQRVHDDVLRSARWSAGRTYRYDRWVPDERRSARQTGSRRHPALAEVERWLVRRYRVAFAGVTLQEYRHAQESLGFHRDRAMTWLDDTLVALLSLGAARPFLLRPETGRPVIDAEDALRDAVDIAPRGGDLLVMGGRCQRDWQHAVPPVPYAVGNRISAQWRWTSRRGEPELDPASRDPRFFSDRPPGFGAGRSGGPPAPPRAGPRGGARGASHGGSGGGGGGGGATRRPRRRPE